MHTRFSQEKYKNIKTHINHSFLFTEFQTYLFSIQYYSTIERNFMLRIIIFFVFLQSYEFARIFQNFSPASFAN
ncbi:MAG: hypothetical protein KatS3mg034_1337 [Vicingaceae bacterium]|nr:MAG: hypothetical protein KatS3mg034_1337 [Vicingaceae bacterium]